MSYLDDDPKTSHAVFMGEWRRQDEVLQREVRESVAREAGRISEQVVRVVPYAGTETIADMPRAVDIPDNDWINRPA